MPGGFHSSAVAAVRPTGGVEGAISAAGRVAPSDDGAAVAGGGGRGVQRCALFDAGVGGVSHQLQAGIRSQSDRFRQLAYWNGGAVQTTTGINCPAARRAGGGGHTAIVELQVFADQYDLTANAVQGIGMDSAALVYEWAGGAASRYRPLSPNPQCC